jgi:hypothetical protein
MIVAAGPIEPCLAVIVTSIGLIDTMVESRIVPDAGIFCSKCQFYDYADCLKPKMMNG